MERDFGIAMCSLEVTRRTSVTLTSCAAPVDCFPDEDVAFGRQTGSACRTTSFSSDGRDTEAVALRPRTGLSIDLSGRCSGGDERSGSSSDGRMGIFVVVLKRKRNGTVTTGMSRSWQEKRGKKEGKREEGRRKERGDHTAIYLFLFYIFYISLW